MGILEPIEEKDLNLHDKFVGDDQEKSSASPEIKESKGDFVLEEIKNPVEKGIQKEGSSGFDKILSKIPAASSGLSSTSMAAVQDDAQKVSAEENIQSKIDTLIKIATTKGVAHAVEVARKSQDNYVLDEMHDKLLTDEFHDALVKNGLIEE